MAGSSDSGRLSPKQVTAVDVLLSTGSLKEAAEKASVSDRTLRRWRRESAMFREEYDARRREALEDGAARLHEASASAVAVLAAEMEGADSATVRVRAATNLLRLGLLAHNQLDLDERLRALEEFLEGAHGGE